MNIKFFNIAAAIFLFSSTIANAGLLNVGDLVTDGTGVQWQYVGEYDVASGPLYYDANGDGTDDDPAPIYSGISAAEENFGTLSLNETYAISTVETTVEHRAWFSAFDSFFEVLAEDTYLDEGSDGFYAERGDYSAWVSDREPFDPNDPFSIPLNSDPLNINYVFKSVNVSEPSTIAILSLSLLAFSRRFRKNNF